MTLSSRRPGQVVRGLGWAILLTLLTATLVGAATADRSAWPSLIGDEATYAMQAASLAFDGDLAYERRDFDRFAEHWGVPPDGLILQSRNNGLDLTYGKSFLYALAVAPATRLAPVRGPLVANALFLALTCLLVAWVLERRVGPAAALWVAVFAFASVSFAYVFWVHADLFLLCAAAAGLALAYLGEPRAVTHGHLTDVYRPPRGEWESAGPWRPVPRWLLVGVLLAVPGAYRPLYLGLLLPALLAARAEAVEDRGGAGRRVAALLVGAALLLGLSSMVQWSAGGDWSPYGGERRGFYGATDGFPDVDFPRAAWYDSVRRWGNTSWFHEGAVDSRLETVDLGLWGWNSLYFLAGRNVGVLPYFLPVVLGLALFVPWRGRWALLLAVAAAVAALFFVRPFNFYGGGGAIANRYFLPIYPALWFCAGRGPTARDPAGWRRAGGALLVAALAALFLWPLWSAPRAFPIGDDGRYSFVSPVAGDWLPYETTQSHIPGGRDKAVDGLWVKLLSGVDLAAGGEGTGDAGWRLTGDGPGVLLVGSGQPLERLYLEFAPGGPAKVRVGGEEPERTVLAADGGTAFLVAIEETRAVHPMWWTNDDFYLYRVEIEIEAGEAGAGEGATFGMRRGGSTDIRPSGSAGR